MWAALGGPIRRAKAGGRTSSEAEAHGPLVDPDVFDVEHAMSPDYSPDVVFGSPGRAAAAAAPVGLAPSKN